MSQSRIFPTAPNPSNPAQPAKHVWERVGPALGCTKYQKPPSSAKIQVNRPTDPLPGYTGFVPIK